MKKVDASISANATPLQKFVISQNFNMFMMAVIILNCIVIAIEDPKVDEQVLWIKGLTWFFDFIYVFEVTVGIVAFGIVRYLIDPWHYIDIVVSGISALDIITVALDAIIKFFGGPGLVFDPGAASNIKLLRIMRALRPLKAVSFIPSLLIYLDSVSHSWLEIAMTMLLLIMVMFVFAATGCAWIGDSLSYRCLPVSITSAEVAADPFFKTFGASYYTSKYNTNFCGIDGLNPTCAAGFACQPVTFQGFFEGGSGDYSTPWRSFISNMSFLTLRGWPVLFWQIADSKGMLVAYVMFTINVLFGTIMVVNLFPAIFICAFRINQEKHTKNTWLLYYPGIIDEVKELELFRWAFNSSHLLQKAAEEASEASIPTQVFRWFYSKMDPADHEAAMKKVAAQKLEYMSKKENQGKGADDRVGVVPWRPCFPDCCVLWDKLRPMILKDDSYFSIFINATIIANIIVLSSDVPNPTAIHEEMKFLLNVIFNSIFALEVVVKVSLLGPCVYLDSMFNLFDVLLVAFGLLQYGTTVPTFISNLRIIRLLRLARLYKLLKLVKSEKIVATDPTVTPGRLLGMLLDLIPTMSNALLMTCILLYIFALVGMQFMIYNYPFREHLTALVYPVPENATPYNLFDAFSGIYRDRMNFNNFLNAFVTVFNVMVFNGWHTVMLETIRFKGSTSFAWYYIFLIFLCNYFTVSALAATVCNVMDGHATEALKEQAHYNTLVLLRLAATRQKVIIKRYFEIFKTNTVQNEEARQAAKASGVVAVKCGIDIAEQFEEAPAISFWDQLSKERAEYSFFIFQPIDTPNVLTGGIDSHKNVRYYAEKFFDSYFFQILIWISLTWAVLSIMAIDRKVTEPTTPVLQPILDYSLVCVFLLEFVVKMIMYTCRGYFSMPMNWVDFITNSAMIIALVMPDFALLDRIRILRIIKIPEMIQHFSSSLSLKLLVSAIGEAPKSLTTVSMTFFILIYFYGVIGLQSWQSRFDFCSDKNYVGGVSFTTKSTNYPNGCNGLAYVQDTYDNYYHWVSISHKEHIDNFDDIFASCKSVFRVFLMNDYQSILYDSLDVVEENSVQPIHNNSRVSFLYYLFGAILGLCLIELFMSTVYYHYMIAQIQFGRKPAFSAAQAAWNVYEGKLRHVHPEIILVEVVKSVLQKTIVKIMDNNYYKALTFGYSIVPLILYVVYFESTYSQSYYAFVDLIFTFFYMFDYLLRFLLNGRKIFQAEGKFEMIIVAVLATSVFQVFPALSGQGVTSFQLKFTWACVMLRMYRVVHSSSLMMNNLRTLQMSISGILPIVLYLFMFTLIFAVIGHTAFENITLDYGSTWLNDKFNFTTYNKSVMTLVAMGTGNFYTEVIMAISAALPGFWWRFFIDFYFVIFMLIYAVLLRTFGLMVILKYIDHTGGMIGMAEEQLRDFQKIWRSLNKDSNDRISFPEFRRLIGRLKKPLGMRGDEQKWIVVERFLKQVLLCMPCPSKYYVDTLNKRDPDANKRNKKRRDLYTLSDLPDSLADLLHDTSSHSLHFTFRQCLIAVHKMALMAKPLPDEEAFQAQRKKFQERLGHFRMAVARVAISEDRKKDPPHAHAYRLLQILQRLDSDLYRTLFISIMERVFRNLMMHINSYGFQSFDGFVLSNLYQAIKIERRAAGLMLRTKKALMASGSPKFIYLYSKAQIYYTNVLRLYMKIENMYESKVAQAWDITSVSTIMTLRERKSISAIEVDHHSNIYVASNGTLKVWKNISGDAAVTKSTKYRKFATIGFDKVHIRAICAAGDGKRFFIAVANDVNMYVLAAGGRAKGKKSPFRLIRTLSHEAPVNAIILFGKYLVTASSDGFISLWVLTTFTMLNRFWVGQGLGDTLGMGGDLSVFCMCLVPITAPGVPKDDLRVTEAVIGGTANGQLVMLPMPLTAKDESSLWVGKRVAVHDTIALPITSVRYAWSYVYASMANGSVTVFAIKSDIDLMKDGDDKLCFIALMRVSYQPIHNAAITGLSFAGDHVFTASHDFSMLPLMVPDSLTAVTSSQYDQVIGSGLVFHSAPILCMTSNNHVLVTGDNDGYIHVTGPSRSEPLLEDGSELDDLTHLIKFSFLEYDFGSVLCAHSDRTLEEECTLLVANTSEDTIYLRWITKKNPCWIIEPSRNDIKPKRHKKKFLYEIASNEKMEFRVVFRPSEGKMYHFSIDFLINETFVVTIHTRGAGVTPKLIYDGIGETVDLGTVDVISPNAKADEIGEGEIRVLQLLSLSSKDIVANLVEEELEDRDTNRKFTMSDRNISVSPRCFKVLPSESVTIVVKFTPSEPYSTFEVPLRFNIAGARYTLVTLRLRSAHKKEPKSVLALIQNPKDKTALAVPGQKVNMMSVHALPKGLRALLPDENIVNSGMVLSLLAQRGWRLASDDVLSCLYHVDTGVFLELPRQIDPNEIVDHVEDIKIKFTVDYDSYFEIWHDDVFLTGGFGNKDVERAVIIKKDLLFICTRREKKGPGSTKDETEEAWLECIGTIILELLIFARSPSIHKAPRPTKKILVPTKDPHIRQTRGQLRSRTDIIVHKGFRLAPGEDGLGYDFLDRMDVAGIERVCSFSEDGYASLYETFRENFIPAGQQVSPIFGSASLTIHTAMENASPTHFKVRDVTGSVDLLHKHDQELHGKMHIHSKEGQITKLDGNQLVELGRPHIMKLEKGNNGFIMQGRVVEVYLNRKGGGKDEATTIFLNPREDDVIPPDPVPKGWTPPPAKPTTMLYCHSMLDMASRSKSANVPVAKLLPHAIISPSHSVRISVTHDTEPELRIAKLSSMIDEMKGVDIKAATRVNAASSSLHDGLFHFILAGNDLKLVSADIHHSSYHEVKTSTDITLTVHGFVAKLDNVTESILYADEGYVLQVDDNKDARAGNGKKVQRFDNFQGSAFPLTPMPAFMIDIWDVRVADAFVDSIRRSFVKLLEQRQQEMQSQFESKIKEMEKLTAEKEADVLKKKGAKEAKEVRNKFLQTVQKMESELTFEKTSKLIYFEMSRRSSEYKEKVEEEAKKKEAERLAANPSLGKVQSKGEAKPSVLQTRRAIEAKGKLVVPLLQDYLEGVTVPGRDVPLSKASAERVLRGLDRDTVTGVVTQDAFKAWFETKPSTALMAELTERTIFARMLLEEYQMTERNVGFTDEDVDDHYFSQHHHAAEEPEDPSDEMKSKWSLSGQWGRWTSAFGSRKADGGNDGGDGEEMKEETREDGDTKPGDEDAEGGEVDGDGDSGDEEVNDPEDEGEVDDSQEEDEGDYEEEEEEGDSGDEEEEEEES